MSEEILLQIKRQPKITISQIATALDVTTRTIERYIALLKREGKLERIGSTKGGSWHIIE